MPSDNAAGAALVPSPPSPVVRRLLDPAFGFIVWIGHFVIIYVANAVACGLQLVSGRSSLLVVWLAAVTVAAAAIVAVHGIRRYRQHARAPEPDFLLPIAVGNDAIAMVAILWQLIPIFMSPVCR